MSDPKPPKDESEEDLGGNIYASYDGSTLILRVTCDSGGHFLTIEPPVWQVLNDWIDRQPGLRQKLEST